MSDTTTPLHVWAAGDEVTAAALNGNFANLLPAQMAAYLASLPTTLPSEPGQVWLNGGTLALS